MNKVLIDRDLLQATAQPAQVQGWQMVPVEPTEEMWGGMARHLMMWLDMGSPTVKNLRSHLKMLGLDWPEWMTGESEMNGDGVPSKGTRATLIYKAMLAAAPKPPAQEPVGEIYDLDGMHMAIWVNGTPDVGTKLYASPVAKQEVDVDTLAQLIREIDGNHTMGAGALAERIAERLNGGKHE